MALTSEQIKEHYEIERELADRLRHATKEDRRTLYAEVYDELFKRVPFHPMLTEKSNPIERKKEVGRELALLRRFFNAQSRFAEIGPGDCYLALEVCKKVKKVYAIDVSAEITKNLNVPANFELIISDGTSISLPEGTMDTVYSNQLMEHLHYEDAAEQLDNILKCLVKGGKYVCITPNRLDGPHDVSKYFDDSATCFHMKEYTFTELKTLFLQTGFSKVHGYWGAKGIYVRIPFTLISWAERFLQNLPRCYRRWRVFRPILPVNVVGVK